MPEPNDINLDTRPVTPPVQFDEAESAFLIEIDRFIWAAQAREAFDVDGSGLTVAVLDTGLNVDHVDFAGRIVATRNFTEDDSGDPTTVTDRNGHGTNVAGLIVADGDHVGIAPGASIVPIKVLSDSGGGSFRWIADALQWVLDNHDRYTISVVCMSLGDGGNYTEDEFSGGIAAEIHQTIARLAEQRVAVCIAAGNDYFSHRSQEGMGFPAIVRECISVGAVYDAEEGGFSYGSGARAFASKPGQLTPFTQRLHHTTNHRTYTDIFAPGAPATSSGINGPHGESTQHGTSQATPVTAGIILLLQQFYRRATGELPSVPRVATWLRRGGVVIFDGDDEDDNVEHTNKYYKHADALSALDAVRRDLQKQRLRDLAADND